MNEEEEVVAIGLGEEAGTVVVYTWSGLGITQAVAERKGTALFEE